MAARVTNLIFALPNLTVDLVAQLVEHNTFNVGALGSSPSGITETKPLRGLILSKGLNSLQNQYLKGIFVLSNLQYFSFFVAFRFTKTSPKCKTSPKSKNNESINYFLPLGSKKKY